MSKRRKKRGNGEDSQLGAENKQMTLLDVPIHEVEAEAKVTKRCTGQLLFENHRRTYDDLVTALAGGGSVRTCMKLFGVGTHTVLAVARREKLEVATRKGDLATAMLLGAEVFAERAIELAPDCESAYEAAGTAKMLAETGNLMRGQATSISAGVIIHVDTAAAAANLQAKAQKMGFGGGEKFAMGAVAPGLALDAGTVDMQSAVAPIYSVDCELVTPFRDTAGGTPKAWKADVFEGGGGGAGEDSCPPP